MNDLIEKFAEQSGYQEGFRFAMEDFDMYKFAELIIREHLIIWEMMDNGNKVAGYVEIEDYPKAIRQHFGV